MSNKIQEAQDELFAQTAHARYLTTIGLNYGVPRPYFADDDDELYRRLIPLLSFDPKTALKNTIQVIECFLGPYWYVFQLINDVPIGTTSITLPVTGALLPNWGRLLFTSDPDSDNWTQYFARQNIGGNDYDVGVNSPVVADMEDLSYTKTGLYSPPIIPDSLELVSNALAPQGTKKFHAKGTFLVIRSGWNLYQTEFNQFTLEIPKAITEIAGDLPSATYMHSCDEIVSHLVANVSAGDTLFPINLPDVANFPNEPFFLTVDDLPPSEENQTALPKTDPNYRQRCSTRKEGFTVVKAGGNLLRIIQERHPRNPFPGDSRVWNIEGVVPALATRDLQFFKHNHATMTTVYCRRVKTDYAGDYFMSYKKWLEDPAWVGIRNAYVFGQNYVDIQPNVPTLPFGEAVIGTGANCDRFLYMQEDDPSLIPPVGNMARLRIVQPWNLSAKYTAIPLPPPPSGGGDWQYSDSLKTNYPPHTRIYVPYYNLAPSVASTDPTMGLYDHAAKIAHPIIIHGTVTFKDLFAILDMVRAAGIVFTVNYIGA